MNTSQCVCCVSVSLLDLRTKNCNGSGEIATITSLKTVVIEVFHSGLWHWCVSSLTMNPYSLHQYVTGVIEA